MHAYGACATSFILTLVEYPSFPAASAHSASLMELSPQPGPLSSTTYSKNKIFMIFFA